MKKKKEKKYFAGVRLPMPTKTGGFHSTKHGTRGYDRKRAQSETQKEVSAAGS